MQDLPQEVLAALAKAGQEWVTSQELAAKLGVDLQKIVGAVKSLEILESYIKTEVNIYIFYIDVYHDVAAGGVSKKMGADFRG